MSHLRLQQLAKHHGTVAALAGVSLELGPAERLLVVGPSGSGKSTLLRLLAGLETPSSGEIHLAGQRFDGLPPERRDVALLGQNPALLPQLTVAANLGLGLRLRGVPAKEADQRVALAAERLGVAALLPRWPSELSGGEQQRVALGRVLVSRPRLLLLDEPLSQLDPALRRSLRAEIARLQRELAVPALWVTHDAEEALELGDQVALLRAGRLEQAGSPEALYRSPRTPFVAEFFDPVGLNRFSGHLATTADGVEFTGPDCAFRIPAAAAPEWRGPGMLGVRAEAIRICGEATGSFQGVVRQVTTLGWERRLELETSGRIWRGRTPEAGDWRSGQTIRWEIDWGRVVWFRDGGADQGAG